ncbi:LysM peptidoglycan-binding domain-containing protein [Luteolibacter sp. Populi]|uniref:LysM peptidoglycan-binding domain-containing protein n=1 Tax=Luteolibacter sp. Populi TaxID=3230487 RepID=UPI0034663BCF
MRALPILAAILCTAPFAKASTTELELLQNRCQEYERQIRQLEQDNAQLKSLVGTAAKTPATIQAEPKKEETPKAAEKSKEDVGAKAIVRSGDTLNKLAKRHGTTPEALSKINGIKDPTKIRAGQMLRLPEKAATSEVTAVARTAPSPHEAAPTKVSTHKVKSGETFFSIARHHRIGAEALQAANPGVKSTNLRIGQTLQIRKPSDTPAPVAKTASTKEPAAPTNKISAAKPATKPAAAPAKEEAAKTEQAKSSEAPKNEASTPAPAPASQPVGNGSRIRTVAIEQNTDFAAFAAAHGTSTAKLNALNGLNLNSSTVLAKGSELYVPAQP